MLGVGPLEAEAVLVRVLVVLLDDVVELRVLGEDDRQLLEAVPPHATPLGGQGAGLAGPREAHRPVVRERDVRHQRDLLAERDLAGDHRVELGVAGGVLGERTDAREVDLDLGPVHDAQRQPLGHLEQQPGVPAPPVRRQVVGVQVNLSHVGELLGERVDEADVPGQVDLPDHVVGTDTEGDVVVQLEGDVR